MNYEELVESKKSIGNMSKEELFTYCNGLLDEIIAELQARIDKAIDYIENCDALLWNEAHKYNFHFDDLLNILGSDKE